MDLTNLLKRATNLGYSSVSGGIQQAASGIHSVSQMVGGLFLFGSTTSAPADQKCDERHYFLIPDRRTADGYSLAILRSLPEGVPPINELPKRRIFHLPNEHSQAMLRDLLIKQTQSTELAKPNAHKSLADRTREIADYIDALDDRVFGGFLLIGGLVALFNPVAGAAIAAKSLLPSLGLFATKYGLQFAGETLTQAELQRKAKQAEQDVLQQFKGSNTINFNSPLLAIWDQALRTTESEYDPELQLNIYLKTELSNEHRLWHKLEATAILGIFAESAESPLKAKQASLGPEDLGFLAILQTLKQMEVTPDA
ncbi:MAG: hypothetical protein JNL67_21240 [Planctomycetaceae bacterium]|nr:hypothetical protein [Planctomycetaceae bacterium]